MRFVSSGAAFADSLERNRMFSVSDRCFIDSIVRFASSGAAFADSLERNHMFCVSDRSFY